MKKALTLIFLACGLFAQAQQKLYYFISKDNLIGVKNQNGKIVIPAEHKSIDEIKNNEIVKGNLIMLFPATVKMEEPNSFGVAYNRKGELLFVPFAFDNGPDPINEGLMRYVKNKKVGFVNREGKVVIPAKYDFVTSFNYGIAGYCDGCVWDDSKDKEHPTLKGGTWVYINNKGESLQLLNEKKSPKDQILDSMQYLPYPFSYSAFEQKIIDSFTKLSIISKAYFVNYYDSLDNAERVLHYEIVEKPSPFFPYYQVKAFSFTNDKGYYGDSQLDFYVSKNGKQYFKTDGYYNKKLIPFAKWLKEYVKDAKAYLKTHTDAMNRF